MPKLFKAATTTITFFALQLLCLSTIYAQTTVLRGVVSDYETGRGLEMANITLQMISGDYADGTTSDRNGLYQFNRLETGNYIFTVRYIGYQSYRDTLTLEEAEGNIVKHVSLVRSNEDLDELLVSASQDEDLQAGQRSIQAEDFSRAPTPAGSADLAGYLQTQPGVVATGDRGGQLFVRGGTPSENLVLMDGTLIYQPFHIVGFFSVFPEDVISNVDFYAGGFGAKYSTRTSSVMDIKLKNGNLYERNWSASISPFISDLFFETPLKKGKSSVLISARGSLIESASELYLNEKQPLRFNSQLIKYSNINGQGLSCSAHALRTYDRGQLDFQGEDFFKWSNIAAGGRCAGVSQETAVSFMDINFGVSHFSNEVESLSNPGRSSEVFKSHLGFNLIQYIGDFRLDYGFFTSLRSIDFNIGEKFISLEKGKRTFLGTGAYASLNIPIGNKFSIDTGASYTSYLNKFNPSFEPRLQLSWQPRGRENEEIHAAFGIYQQLLAGVTDYRDAGTAFTAWMPIPDSNRRMEAKHALAGWRQPLGNFVDFSVEGYFKKMQDIPVSVWSSVPTFTTDLAYANATIRGMDIRFNFNHRFFYAGFGYGYSLTEYETAQDHFSTWFGEPVQKYNPPHDRRHQINIQSGLEFHNFSLNISWIYGSGLPFTRPMGFDNFFDFREKPPDVTGEYGTPRVLLEKPFQGRMPDFHRLDVSVEQAFNLNFAKLTIQGGAINTYDWTNLFYYDVFYQREIEQMPFMPYVSLKMGSI